MIQADVAEPSRMKRRRIILGIILVLLTAALIIGGYLLLSRPSSDTLLTWTGTLTVEDVEQAWMSCKDYSEHIPTGEDRNLQGEELADIVAWINEIGTENLYYDVTGEIGAGYADRFISQFLWVETAEIRCLFKHSPADPGYLQITLEWVNGSDQQDHAALNPQRGNFCLVDSPLVDLVEDWTECVQT